MFEEIRAGIKKYENVCELTRPASGAALQNFRRTAGIGLPQDLQSWLTGVANGGELFIPGTVLYGIYDPGCGRRQQMEELIAYWNQPAVREKYRLPPDFLPVGLTNYGNLVGWEEKAHRYAEWDHETEEITACWDSLEEWLDEELSVYQTNLARMEAFRKAGDGR